MEKLDIYVFIAFSHAIFQRDLSNSCFYFDMGAITSKGILEPWTHGFFMERVAISFLEG